MEKKPRIFQLQNLNGTQKKNEKLNKYLNNCNKKQI